MFTENGTYVKHIVNDMPEGELVQHCIICGAIISDYRNTVSPRGTPPSKGYAAGPVYVMEGNPRISTRIIKPTEKSSLCQK